MERVTVLYIYGDSRTYDDNIMQEDISVNWIKCIYASAKSTNSQISSSYIACIAFMMDSQPASCPAKTCCDPTDVTISVWKWVATTFPVIGPRTSTISIGRRRGFLSSGINRRGRNASKDADWFSMLNIFLITSTNGFHRSRDLFRNFFDVKIHFQPYASMPDGIELPWVLTAAFYTFSTSILSNLIGWIVCGVSISNIS